MNSAAAEEAVLEELSIAVTATFTAEPLEEPIKFWLGELGISARIEFAPFGLIFQELLDPASLLNRNTTGLNVILIRPEDWCSSKQKYTSGTGYDDPAASLKNNVTEFVSALRAASECSRVPFMVCLCHGKPQHQTNIGLSNRFTEIIDQLISDMQAIPNVSPVSASDLDSLYPVAGYYDAERDKLASIPYTSLYYVSLATTIMRYLYSLLTPDIKVIVLDCDNTLWKGICGEAGPHAVDVDFSSRMLQEFMVAQYDKGVLLCLCSKNNTQDVKDVFDLQVGMPLGLGHFVSMRINWKPKSENLVSLSEELGLGLDSFVFIDDDPVECNEVLTRCPSVITLQLPRQRPHIPEFLRHAWVFDHPDTTQEAGNRNVLYRRDTVRKSAEAGAGSLEDFLAGLELSVEISEMSEDNILRVAELFNRTNQFNATTIRYSENEIRLLLVNKEKTFLVTTAKDRFGDYGLIGVAVYSINSVQMNVDSLLLSCRALGRCIERQLVEKLAQIADVAGCSAINFLYLETERNHLVRDFMESVGSGYSKPVPGGIKYCLPIHCLLEH